MFVPARTAVKARLRVDRFHQNARAFSVFVPGSQGTAAFPSLHFPSVVLDRVQEPEEGRISGPETFDEYFEVQLVNTADFPLVLPHNLQVGWIEEVETVLDVASDVSERHDIETCLAALSPALAPEPGLQDFMVGDEDLEPDSEPPQQAELEAMVASLSLTPQQKAQLLALLVKYAHVFAVRPSAPDGAAVTPHTIDLEPGTKPVFKHAYRMSPAKREELSRQIKEKLEAGMIQPSTSSFSAPVVLAPKHDGSWRFCVDYRALNKVTIPDKFPLPRIDDLLDQLGGNLFFSTMDLAAGFYQIPVAPEDRHKTAFSTPEGLYEWVRMPMGLTNSPATFQRAMNMTLSGLNWQTCLVYLDDIICFSKTFDSHLEQLEEVFIRLVSRGFSLKLKKCAFFKQEVEYLGHVVSRHGRRPHPRNLKAVKEFPRPHGKNMVTHIQMFVGLCNYYASYIPDYVQKVEPLTRLTKIGIGKVWGPEQAESFELLKRDLTAAPLLRHPDFTKRFFIQTDACGYGLGAVLTQEFEDGFHPILYLSRSLQEAERKWAARELEALGVVWAVTKLRPYIEGRAFTVQTDHESLQWLMKTEAPGRLSRWAMKLQEFLPHMSVEYRRGVDNGNADALSRCPVSSLSSAGREMWERSKTRFDVCRSLYEQFNALLFEARATVEEAPRMDPVELTPVVVSSCLTLSPLEEEEKVGSTSDTSWSEPEDGSTAGAAVPATFVHDLIQEYERDEKWRDLILYLKDEDSPLLDDDQKKEMEYRATHFKMRGELLYLVGYFRRNSKDARRRIERLVVPDTLRHYLISLHHDSLTGAHLGSPRVSLTLRTRYYWPRMDQDVRDYVRTCGPCQRAKATRQRSAGLLQPKGWSQPGFLSVDLQGPFPTSHGYDMVLTLKDVFLGVVVLVPLRSKGAGAGGTDAAHVADAVFKHWVRYFGVPRLILTDKGPQFEAHLFARFCERLGIDRRKTSVYHPQTNSQAERQHGFHTPLIKAFCASQPSRWSTFLPYLQFAINSSPMEGLGISPLEALTGFPPLVPADLFLLPLSDSSFAVDKHKYKIEHPKRMKEIHKLMNRVKKGQREKMKERYDETHKDVKYEVGETVLAYKPANVTGSRKLAIDFRGPFEVAKVLGPNHYALRLCGSASQRTIEWTGNVKNLVRYYVRAVAQRNTWAEVDSELPRPVRVPQASRPRGRTRAETSAESEQRAEEQRAESEELEAAAEQRAGAGTESSAAADEEEERAAIEIKNLLSAEFFIAPSPGRGLGVYCRNEHGFRARRPLGEYTGRRLSHEAHRAEVEAGKDPSYALELDKANLVVDALDFRQSRWPRYVNGTGPGEEPNVLLVEVDGRAMVMTSKPIEYGEELLVDYGPEYDWSNVVRVSGDPARRLESFPPRNPVGEALKAQVEEAVLGTAGEGQSAAAEGKEPATADLDAQEPLPDDVVAGRFVLIMHEPAPTTLELVKVVTVDELREHATVHSYGTWGRDPATAVFRPWYLDPKDEKYVLSSRPLKRYLSSTRQIFAEHVQSETFQLRSGGRLPRNVAGYDWEVSGE
jgi:hypothetical protein